MSRLEIDQQLLDATIEATSQGISMTGLEPRPVGASSFPRGPSDLMVLVSLYGDRNGMMTLNLARGTSCFLADRLLGEERDAFDEDTIDAVCEIGNIVAGRYKELLGGGEYRVTGISLPALILGANFNLHHYRGITTVAVDFEIPEISMVNVKDRFFTSAVSFLRK